MNNIFLDSEQLRILNWRAANKDIAAVVGPPGCGKTTVGSSLAVKLIAEGLVNRVLLAAYTNAAANEFGWELYNILGNTAQKFCVRTGNPTGIDPILNDYIPFRRHIHDIVDKKIVICTTLSLKMLTKNMRFDNIIVDEAGINRIEHILWPFSLGIDPMASYKWRNDNVDGNNQNGQINDLLDLVARSGVVATVIGDPKQSRPISPDRRDYSAIEWIIKRTRSDTLRLSHRLPDQLSGLVNDFAKYGGLRSAPEIASRRLILNRQPDIEYRYIIQPSDVTTWVDISKGIEEPIGPSSWANETEAKTCAKICHQLRYIAPQKSIVIITRYTAQKQLIRSYLQSMGIGESIKVTTTTGALGTQADIVIFSLVRNNPENNVGAAGTLQDVNVAISRSKEKLIILGNFEMMLNGWTFSPTDSRHGYKSPARDLAHLVDHKYGKVVESPHILK
jgi:energy-coupling factor transporter ATP-binding protein EcfA2